MEYDQIHIEVYLKNKENGHTHIGYEIVDNDAEILFAPFILQDCLKEFQNNEGEQLIFISSFELTQRLNYMRQIIINIPSDILYKVECLIKFITQREKIENNQELYMGIRTIFLKKIKKNKKWLNKG